MEYVPLEAGELNVGQPAHCDVFDQQGSLLLKQGMILRSQRQLARLMKEQPQRASAQHSLSLEELDALQIRDVLSPFGKLDTVVQHLEVLFEKLLSHHHKKNTAALSKALTRLAGTMVALCEYDVDAILGAAHLGHKYRYTIVHPIHTAVLCYLVARNLRLSKTNIYSLMGAALTANIGMYHLQETLFAQQEPLSEEQKKDIKRHPVKSAVILKHSGIRDRLWLEIVLQHHENADGGGYPRKLKDSAFIREARVLALADRYHAMVSSRKHRKGMSPTQALRKLFENGGGEIDQTLSLMFIKEVGIFPPGTQVRLSNGELAIVTRRTEDSMKPEVKAVTAANKQALAEPQKRDLDDPYLEIVSIVDEIPGELPDLRMLWDYFV